MFKEVLADKYKDTTQAAQNKNSDDNVNNSFVFLWFASVALFH
jgi:hypothetical protein